MLDVVHMPDWQMADFNTCFEYIFFLPFCFIHFPSKKKPQQNPSIVLMVKKLFRFVIKNTVYYCGNVYSFQIFYFFPYKAVMCSGVTTYNSDAS